MISPLKKVLIPFFLVVIVLGYLSCQWFREQKSPVPTSPSPDTSSFFHTGLGMSEAFSATPPGSFAELTKKVKTAVVNISTTKEVRTRQMAPWGFDPFGMFGQPGGQPSERAANSLGSGFIINENGYVLTNNHVVEGADEIVVKLDDGRNVEAKLVGRDAKLDIAVLKLKNPGPYPYVTLGDSEKLEVGDWVVAIGNPFGLGQTVTSGIVSAKARVLGAGPYDDFIQTDASINPGNSGGPLFNLAGEVVGINTAIIATGQGLGFAIPVNMAKDVVPQLISTGQVTRGWLGIAIGDLTPELAARQGLDKPVGALIAQVVPGGPADRIGMRAGDIVVEFNGHAVDSAHILPTLVAKVPPGGSAKVVFLHDGKKIERDVVLGSLDNPPVAAGGSAGLVKGVMGMTIRDLSDAEKARLRIGVMVTDVSSGSMAEAIGIVPGDAILEINGQALRNAADLKKRFEAIPAGAVVRMTLGRSQGVYYFAFKKE